MIDLLTVGNTPLCVPPMQQCIRQPNHLPHGRCACDLVTQLEKEQTKSRHVFGARWDSDCPQAWETITLDECGFGHSCLGFDYGKGHV